MNLRDYTHWITTFLITALLVPTTFTLAQTEQAGKMSPGMSMHEEHISDQQIVNAIRDQFASDHAINAKEIAVESNEGIIELTGSVSHILAKERAEKLTERIKGVLAVSNRIEIEPLFAQTDLQISNNVEGALYGDPATDSYEVDVSVSNRVVTLTGTVDSYQEKELCGYVAKSVTGVTGLKNALKVDYREARPDLVLEKEVRNALKWNIMVDERLVNVEADNGAVTLSGVVGSAAERSYAFAIAWVAGVNSVDISQLKVQWWEDENQLRRYAAPAMTDKEIEDAIISVSSYDPRVYSYNINPVVENGWVTLRGSVDNLRAKKAAENLANNTLGVTGVTNEIDITTDNGLSDTEIRQNIVNGLAVNSVTEGYQIDVAVEDGLVMLSGSVETFTEKTEAEWVAAGQYGVKGIDSKIEVKYPSTFYWNGFYPYYSYNFPTSTYPVPAMLEGSHIAPPLDDEIRRSVNNQLWWSPFVDADDVNVEVEDGTVTLTGSVDSKRESSAAVENAWEGGAWAVVNKLTIDQN